MLLVFGTLDRCTHIALDRGNGLGTEALQLARNHLRHRNVHRNRVLTKPLPRDLCKPCGCIRRRDALTVDVEIRTRGCDDNGIGIIAGPGLQAQTCWLGNRS